MKINTKLVTGLVDLFKYIELIKHNYNLTSKNYDGLLKGYYLKKHKVELNFYYDETTKTYKLIITGFKAVKLLIATYDNNECLEIKHNILVDNVINEYYDALHNKDEVCDLNANISVDIPAILHYRMMETANMLNIDLSVFISNCYSIYLLRNNKEN